MQRLIQFLVVLGAVWVCWQKMSAVLGRARLAVLGAALGVASCGFPDYAGFAPPEVDSGSPAKDGAGSDVRAPTCRDGAKTATSPTSTAGAACAQPVRRAKRAPRRTIARRGMYQRRVRHAGMHGPRQERRRDRRRLRRKLSHHLRLGQNVRDQLRLRRRSLYGKTLSAGCLRRRGQERGRGGHRLRGSLQGVRSGQGVRRRKDCATGVCSNTPAAPSVDAGTEAGSLAEGVRRRRGRGDFPSLSARRLQ